MLSDAVAQDDDETLSLVKRNRGDIADETYL